MAAHRLTPDPLHVDPDRVAIDEPLLQRLHVRLFDPDTASAALAAAGALAVRAPAVAAMIAERVRADRLQRRHEVQLPMGTPSRTVDWHIAARAVERSGCISLSTTAMLELEERRVPDPSWASALVAIAGDHGHAHLARMRSRPAWSALSPTPPAVGLDALVSPIADVRAVALQTLAAAPRHEHLRALLLATELDRHIIRNVLRTSWIQPPSSAWLAILATHPAAKRLDRRLAGLPPGALAAARDQCGASIVFDYFDTRGKLLLVELVDAGAARMPLDGEQQLTPSLRELEAIGAAAFAARLGPDPRLTADERAELESAEWDLARSSAQRWGPETTGAP